MIKSKELTDPNSCMSRAKDDEMTFVLLGRDKAARAAIVTWIAERIRLGKNKATDPQIVEALSCLSGFAAEDEKPSCLWTESEDENWETACGNTFNVDMGTPKENEYEFCPGCGNKLEEKRYRPPEDEEE